MKQSNPEKKKIVRI